MDKPLVDRIPFAKILIGLAIVFVLSLGLCGLTARSVMHGGANSAGFNRLLQQIVAYDVAAMVLSAAGLVLTPVVWIVMSVVSRIRRSGSGTQK